ncbi:MAG: hypothetical protein IPJ65_42415 [Archangiaceae bacterium]|nr:hypothetical protein [Archangiaceae bacterium]
MFRPALLAVSLLPLTVFANASGAIGYSGAPGTGSCNDCHSGGAAPTVTINGPDTLNAGATGMYTCTVTGGSRVGVNIAVTEMLAALNPVSANLGIAFRELFQVSPQNSGTTFSFSLTAPPVAGPMTIYAVGNAVNGNGATSGDRSANATKMVTIMAAAGSPADPVISTPAAAMVSPLRAKSTQVSVTAADDGGPTQLTYIWSSTGPGAVTFSPNSSNSAATSTATFSRPGTYMLTVTVRDGANHTKTSSFSLSVESELLGIKMTPYAIHLNPGQTQAFTAVAVDQFEAPISPQPTITYEAMAGGGTFGSGCTVGCTSNMFKAQSGNGGPFPVGGRSGGIVTSSTVAIGTTPLPGATDTVPPTVSLIAPESGLALTNGEIFEAVANDATGVAKVEFQISQVPVGSVTSSPWRFTYMTAVGLPSGKQPLTAVATDLAGNITISSSVIVDVPVTTGTGGGSGTAGGSSGTGGGSTGGSGGHAGGGITGGGGGGCECGVTEPTNVIAGLLALLAYVRSRRRSRQS